ncbi:hypothetical protein [Streptomyces sp. V1I1]|uniref:hypothetical protein n=1 Tax=Streptomyces sp. V1I1 TaxID=3042272 RepID=UPI00277D269E|nr:hypothetical protein [Streptomyces sp. V1I1]MDQ0938357.1 hypothetical protein [Streptomyces sp. V1I1]
MTDGPDRSRGDPGANSAPTRRITVAHPRTLAALGGRQLPANGREPVADDLGRQTPLGDIYLRSLMRAQLRLGLAVVGVLVAVLGGLPFLFLAAPALRNSIVAGVPVPWLIIGAAVHPVILTLAFVCLRHAGRNEHDFTELVERS